MEKSAIDTPSREIDLGNIPVHLRTALRRALEFEARAPAPRSAEEAEQCEEQLRAIADEFFGALLTPVLQRAVRSAAVGDAASALVRHLPRRMRSDGLETVNVRTSRGTTVPVTTPYYREKHARRAKRRPGLYPALVVLGIYDRCTPKLASDASRAVAMHSSLAEAQAQLRSDGIALDIKTLRSTAYRYAARARAAQQSAACGLLDRVTGKRVVVSLDGGRVRVRRKKRGPKTKKGRNRFHTDWKEPKLLILYVVGDDGRPSQTWAPIIDGTLRGPEAVFALLLSYARQIGLNAADKVLFIADGAPWIWRRLQRLIAALGLSPTQVLGLIDFYHAAKQLSDAVKLRRWSATQRTRWLNRTRGLLKRARVDEVITALRELCRGRTAGKIRTHLNYFLKNRHRFAYTTMVGLGLPRGSGAVESAIRRVINLRIKGASIYWLPESVDAILLLRSFYKSGRWNCLQRMAMTPVGVSAFRRGERKDDRTQEYLRQWSGGEGVLYIGKAQEKARVLRTERRHNPATGATCAWLVDSTAMVNHFYFYAVDDDFGPFFLKFCSYFPYNAKLCINGHEYLKRQLTKRGNRVRAARQRHPELRGPRGHAAARRRTDGRENRRAAAQVAGPAAAPLRGRRPGAGHPLRHLHAASRVRPHRGLRPTGAGTGLLRRGAAREPRHGPARPRAVALQPARQPTHPHAASHPRHYRRGHPVAACGLGSLSSSSLWMGSSARRSPSLQSGWPQAMPKMRWPIRSASECRVLSGARLSNRHPANALTRP